MGEGAGYPRAPSPVRRAVGAAVKRARPPPPHKDAPPPATGGSTVGINPPPFSRGGIGTRRCRIRPPTLPRSPPTAPRRHRRRRALLPPLPGSTAVAVASYSLCSTTRRAALRRGGAPSIRTGSFCNSRGAEGQLTLERGAAPGLLGRRGLPTVDGKTRTSPSQHHVWILTQLGAGFRRENEFCGLLQ